MSFLFISLFFCSISFAQDSSETSSNEDTDTIEENQTTNETMSESLKESHLCQVKHSLVFEPCLTSEQCNNENHCEIVASSCESDQDCSPGDVCDPETQSCSKTHVNESIQQPEKIRNEENSLIGQLILKSGIVYKEKSKKEILSNDRFYSFRQLNHRTVAATTIGTLTGIGVGYIGGGIICLEKTSYTWECLNNIWVLGGTALLGSGGGYLAYNNNRTYMTFIGALSGVGVAATFGFSLEPELSGGALVPVMMFSAIGGGYLGYRFWEARETNGASYSFSPYWDHERSGVVLSGQF